MSNTEKDRLAEKIYHRLFSQNFASWYNDGDFDKHISGDIDCPTKNEILNDIKYLFGLNEM